MSGDITVSEGAAGERLDMFLAPKLAVTRSQVQRLIRSGQVLVNDSTQRTGYPVRSGDLITIKPPVEEPTAQAAPNLRIVYEDPDILVVEKPSGLAAHPGYGRPGEATVADFARLHTTDPDPIRPGIIHRLDRDTSGLLILAKTAEAKVYMQRQFAERLVHKTYTVLAVGTVNPAEAVIRLPTGRDPAHPLQQAVVASGREAVTRYKTLANFTGFTLLEAKPETGRTHQIRVHFAAMGHPVAGDTIYGSQRRLLGGLRRQFLHATRIEFTAPSGKVVTVTSPLPPDLEHALGSVGGSGIIDA